MHSWEAHMPSLVGRYFLRTSLQNAIFFFSGIEKLKSSCVYSTNLHDESNNLIIR